MVAPAVPITIRPMQEDDLDPVREIDYLSFRSPWPKKAFAYELRENDLAHLWVAEGKFPGEDPRVLGALVIWLVLDEAHIGTVAIHPHYRRQGIGRALLIAALGQLHEKGAQTIMLEVRRSNYAAQKMYRDLGFAVVGERKAYYADNREDAILMTLTNIEAWGRAEGN